MIYSCRQVHSSPGAGPGTSRYRPAAKAAKSSKRQQKAAKADESFLYAKDLFLRLFPTLTQNNSAATGGRDLRHHSAASNYCSDKTRLKEEKADRRCE